MKKTIILILILITNINIYAQSFGASIIENDAFRFSSTYGDLLMRRYNSGDTTWKRALVPTANQLHINYGGDFSIGTRIHGSKLDVDGNVNIGGVISNTAFRFSSTYGDLLMRRHNSGDTTWKRALVPTANQLHINYGGDFSSGTRIMGEKLHIDGNVGIGTANPDSELTVDGKIHCEEVQVDLQVPADYVFEKYYTGVSELKEEYIMPTLAEVEKYTKENHHLPNIPSATEIKEEGLHLKEMTNLLLQKVEELTLYTIEQEKRIKALETQLTSEK